MNTGVFSNVCTKFGFIASFNNAVTAPCILRSETFNALPERV